jgi:hypothetical protein
VYLPSFLEQYAATGDAEARRQVLAAAEATAWAFNPATNSTRTFEGWDPPASTEDFRCGARAFLGCCSGSCGSGGQAVAFVWAVLVVATAAFGMRLRDACLNLTCSPTTNNTQRLDPSQHL